MDTIKIKNCKACVVNLPAIAADAAKGVEAFGPYSMAPGEVVTLSEAQAVALGASASVVVYLKAGVLKEV